MMMRIEEACSNSTTPTAKTVRSGGGGKEIDLAAASRNDEMAREKFVI